MQHFNWKMTRQSINIPTAWSLDLDKNLFDVKPTWVLIQILWQLFLVLGNFTPLSVYKGNRHWVLNGLHKPQLYCRQFMLIDLAEHLWISIKLRLIAILSHGTRSRRHGNGSNRCARQSLLYGKCNQCANKGRAPRGPIKVVAICKLRELSSQVMS